MGYRIQKNVQRFPQDKLGSSKLVYQNKNKFCFKFSDGCQIDMNNLWLYTQARAQEFLHGGARFSERNFFFGIQNKTCPEKEQKYPSNQDAHLSTSEMRIR